MFDHEHEFQERLLEALKRVSESLSNQELLNHISRKVDTIMAALDDLKAQVAQNTTVEGSALALINGFGAKLDAAVAAAVAGDSTALPALQAELKASADPLAAAVAANTPAA